jgi:RNA polymerase sigma-70 factor (ECF subfamily)
MELSELLDRCRRGDELAWEALVRRHQGRVYGFVLHYVRDADEARDLAQEVFVRVYERLSSFRGHETFVPWLMRLARNLCVDHHRRRKARVPAFDLPLDGRPDLPDAGPSPEAAFAADARSRLVRRALGTLSEPYREVILLKDVHGLKLEEIATMLGVPLGTVKSRSSRARLELARAVLALSPAPPGGPG